jgi:hypothetical protein
MSSRREFFTPLGGAAAATLSVEERSCSGHHCNDSV